MPAQSLDAACKQVRTCIQIAVDCMETDRRRRPTMKKILHRLREVDTKENDSLSKINQWKPSLPSTQPNENQTQKPRLPSTLPTNLPSEYLKAITDGFSLERKLGQGSFGTMYKGILEDGTVIVVEKLSGAPDKYFQDEVGKLMAINHENVVKLVSFCYETEKMVVEHNGANILADVAVECLLCFEYVQDRTLAKYIYGESCQLDWNTRFKIIMGICQGLQFFLKGMNGPFAHLHLNPSNIMLDNNMVPKIAQFRIWRLFGQEEAQMKARNSVVAGGYMAPEYLHRGVVSTKTDIYRLGFLILEIVTGEKNIHDNKDHPWSATLFADNVRQNWTDEDIAWNYPSLEASVLCQVKICIEVGLSCVNPEGRPWISDIIKKLRKTRYLYPRPVEIRSSFISYLRVQPRQLCFTWDPKRLKSCSLYLTNITNYSIAFSLHTENPRRYHTKLPFCGIVLSKCSYTLTVTMREQKKALSNSDEFLTLQSAIVPGQDLKNATPVSVAMFFEEVRKMANHEVQEVIIPVMCNPPEETTSDQLIQSAAVEIIASPNYRRVLSIDVHPTEPW